MGLRKLAGAADEAEEHCTIIHRCKPPPPTLPHNHYYKRMTVATIMASMLATALLIGMFCLVFRLYLNRRRRRNPMARSSLPLYFGTQEDFVDEGRGPEPHSELDNPIWYINTVGLQQSVIDSITVFKYKKDGGLIEVEGEGTADCSVCLSEFQEDETLRLLPKCSHAFHLPCIDTWLASHKNCPLCRAPILSETLVIAHPSSTHPISIDNEPHSLQPVQNSVSDDDDIYGEGQGQGPSQVLTSSDTTTSPCPSETGNTTTSENYYNSKTISWDFCSKARIRTDSDSQLVFPRSSTDVQALRRSVSLDLSSAQVIYSDVALILGTQAHKHKHGGSLDSSAELQEQKNPKPKRGSLSLSSSSSSSMCKKMMKSSLSTGRSSCSSSSLSKGPMKRSISSGGKFLLFKQSSTATSTSTGTSQASIHILPL